MIKPYENEIFFNPMGLRVWELRHSFFTDILTEITARKVLRFLI
jgi:hypothetical protein